MPYKKMANIEEKRYLKPRDFLQSSNHDCAQEPSKNNRFLKRQSGISLEFLIKMLEKHNIPYSLESQKTTDKYFRETIVKVSHRLIDLFNNYDIIPNVQLRQFNEKENYIDLYASYNFVIFSNNANPAIDEDYIEIIPEYAKKLEMEKKIPTNQPMEKIRIIKS